MIEFPGHDFEDDEVIVFGVATLFHIPSAGARVKLVMPPNRSFISLRTRPYSALGKRRPWAFASGSRICTRCIAGLDERSVEDILRAGPTHN